MTRFRHLILFVFLINGFTAWSQKDSLYHSVIGGKASGYWRTFFMATDNEGDLKDWNALATGGKLKYETSSFYGFKIGAAVHHSSNLKISDITATDPTTGRYSRYESGLFDVNDLSRTEITLLGEAYLSYRLKGHFVQVGRFQLKTPFLNPEDGRMIPTLEQGIWYDYQSKKKTLFARLAWITHIGARSTSDFMPVGQSIGSYPQGRNPDGSLAQYRNSLSSMGLGIASIEYKGKKVGAKFWNYYVDNIYNTAFIQAYVSKEVAKVKHTVSAQYLNQSKMNQGGNSDPAKAYVHDAQANVIGAQYELKWNKKWRVSGNYNYVTNDGRFLFPREWGREFLFVFQKRERLEGVSNTHAWMVDVQRTLTFKKAGALVAKIGYGQYYRPDALNFDNNKYAFPANDQLNLDLFYFTRSDKKGLVIEWLTTWKRALGDTYDNPKLVLNKVNMFNHNLVVNYRF
ncbi:hypothetical protein KFE98_17920 [bacterium SCSIO 12741]|nr:hypothetical protein KFE98_17920 [bacterium SCSIO 12741]